MQPRATIRMSRTIGPLQEDRPRKQPSGAWASLIGKVAPGPSLIGKVGGREARGQVGRAGLVLLRGRRWLNALAPLNVPSTLAKIPWKGWKGRLGTR